jgi:hypothetical protein
MYVCFLLVNVSSEYKVVWNKDRLKPIAHSRAQRLILVS